MYRTSELKEIIRDRKQAKVARGLFNSLVPLLVAGLLAYFLYYVQSNYQPKDRDLIEIKKSIG
jgi:hypothetical protein